MCVCVCVYVYVCVCVRACVCIRSNGVWDRADGGAVVWIDHFVMS
uniref:Bm282 n=1 Tax=Brugia malayi TaxID=6279 RepID=A0A0J9XNW4_BRUMA|nr:Bm282 [Brugia malayi]